MILDRFFGGDAAAYHDRSNTKSTKFSDFVKTHATNLEFLGLNERILRSCLQERTVYLTLPPTARARLGYSRTLALTSVDDATKQAQMAKVAIDHNWTLSQLREAIQDDRAGLWYDTDNEAAGVQPPTKAAEDGDAAKPLAAGHSANRAKRWADDANAVAADWTQVDASMLSKAQRKLACDALHGAAAAVRSSTRCQRKANAVAFGPVKEQVNRHVRGAERRVDLQSRELATHQASSGPT